MWHMCYYVMSCNYCISCLLLFLCSILYVPVEPYTHVIIEFYLQRVLPEVGVVIVHVGLDRGTKKSLLVESFESLPVYFRIVSSRKDYFTLTVVSCDPHNPLGT